MHTCLNFKQDKIMYIHTSSTLSPIMFNGCKSMIFSLLCRKPHVVLVLSLVHGVPV